MLCHMRERLELTYGSLKYTRKRMHGRRVQVRHYMYLLAGNLARAVTLST